MEPGQAIEQPALNIAQGIAAVAAMIEQDQSPEKPRDEKGRFAKPEATEVKPETETPEVAAEATSTEELQTETTQRRFKLKYKGEEFEKDENEALELAQKGFDYTQKMQALAKEREEMPVKLRTEIEARTKQYETQLETYKQAVLKLADPEALSADLNQIAVQDPNKAQQLFFKRMQIQQTLAAIETEQQKLAQSRMQEMQDGLRKKAQESVEKLQEAIPGWNNAIYGEVLKGAVDSYGFESQEVNAITDHRAIKALHDALQWRKYQAAKPKTVDKRVADVPRVTKPGTSEKPDASAAKIQEGMAKLSKSGNKADAVSLVQQLMESGRL